MTRMRWGIAVAIITLLLAGAVPVAAEDDTRTLDPTCQQMAFHTIMDEDISYGSIVGGPFHGWPVIIVSAPGQGPLLNAIVGIPATAVRFVSPAFPDATSPGTVAGLEMDSPAIPPGAFFVTRDQLSTNGIFRTEPRTLILLAQSGTVALDGCG